MLKGLIITSIILLLILNICFWVYGISDTIKRMRCLERKWPYELGIVNNNIFHRNYYFRYYNNMYYDSSINCLKIEKVELI